MSTKHLALQCDQIRLLAFYLNPDVIDISLETWLSTSDEIGIITNDFKLTVLINSYKHVLIQLSEIVS